MPHSTRKRIARAFAALRGKSADTLPLLSGPMPRVKAI